MAGPRNAIAALLARYAAGLRFPTLLAVTGTLFLVDLVVPDFVPLADELLLGLGTLVLASLRKRGGGRDEPAAGDADHTP